MLLRCSDQNLPWDLCLTLPPPLKDETKNASVSEALEVFGGFVRQHLLLGQTSTQPHVYAVERATLGSLGSSD